MAYRQSLRDREVAIALDELEGKITIRQMRDHLKKRGLLQTDTDAIDQWELAETRRMAQRARKYQSSEKQLALELIHFAETTPEGTKDHYWRRFGEVTAEEGVQIVTYWYGKGQYSEKQLYKYYKPLRKRFGKKFDQMLPFSLRPELA